MVLKRKQKGISFGYCDTITGARVYPPKPASEMTDILPEQQPPERKSAPTNASEDAQVRLTCSPSLDQVTHITKEHGTVKFAVLLETSSAGLVRDAEPEVCLWHNLRGPADWSQLPLKPTEAYDDVMLVARPSDRSVSRMWFEAELPGIPKSASVVSFTVKFRIGIAKDWQWVKESTGVQDGELHYQGQDYEHELSAGLDRFFSGVSSDVKVTAEKAETDDTILYSLTCPVSPAKDPDSGYSHHRIGEAKQMTRWFSLVRLWSPWLAPRQGKKQLSLDKDGVLVSFVRTDGKHVVCLGISGVQDVVTTFLSDEEGNLIIKGRNDRLETGTSRVIVAVADSFETANAAVMYHARKVVAEHSVAATSDEIKSLMDDKVKPEWLEEWYDGFTYCTWNGLGQDLTAEKIYTALDDLKSANINITNLIIDDNWQSLSSGSSQFVRAWTDFEANKDGFPSGLKDLTTKIRSDHPNINHIAVWHAILGYWGGVSPDGELAKRYKTIQVEKEPGVAGGKFTVVAAQDAQRMYSDFYAFLSSVGVDAAKTDAQFFLDLLQYAPDRRALITEYQDAWTIAHLRHLGSRAISCMSQSPQLLFHSQLPTNKPRLLVRNSDDFFPDIDASHPWHIFCNAHNSLLTQHLNVLPDWDMFQTSHPWAGFHAAARCVSGGPIYFTDYPGKHDIKLIRQMTAQTVTGKTVILRPHTIGKSTDPYNAYDSQAVLKIGTYVGAARTGTSILGLFNVTTQPLNEFVDLDAFSGTEEGEYVVGAFTTGAFSKPAKRGQAHAMTGVDLPVQGWDILTAYPLRSFEVAGKSVSVSILGLVGKMTGSAAVSGKDVYVETNGRLRFWVQLKALGVLGLYISDLEARNTKQDFMVLMHGQPIPADTVSVSETSKKVLQIDVERAWHESGQKPGWSNEVTLEVFMS
ncbi:hypothetical protein LTR95_016576 [Oleoguttula sp. CCFEE 5521]